MFKLSEILMVVWSVLKLVLLIFNTANEKDKLKKEAQQTAITQIKEGLSEGDASKITAGFDNLNRM